MSLNKLMIPRNLVDTSHIQEKIKKLRNMIKTIKPNIRNKRGLLNIVGSAYKWLFGVMDDDDRIEIEENIKLINTNNKNLIKNANNQIKINNDFQNDILNLENTIKNNNIKTQLIFKEINFNYKIMLKHIDNIQIMQNIHILEDEVEKIQDNINSARLGIMSRSLLNSEEINEFNITLNELEFIKLSLLGNSEKLIFVISIPKYQEKSYPTYYILPIPNNKNTELNIQQREIIIIENKVFEYNSKEVKKLKIIDECTTNIIINKSFNFCQTRINLNHEIIQINRGIIVLINAQYKPYHDCNKIEYELEGNYVIKFKDCNIEINKSKFINNFKEFQNHILLPNYIKLENISKMLNLTETHLNMIQNNKFIREVYFETKSNHIVTIIIGLITIIILIIIVIHKCKQKKKESHQEIKIQENFELKGGGVISQLDNTLKNNKGNSFHDM